METAQQDMRRAYVNGAPGVFVSGLVWLAAGTVWLVQGVPAAFTVLFFGGMLIMPLAIIIARTIYREPKLPPGGQLERLSLESTFVLFAGLLVAYAGLRSAPQAVFPIIVTIIGARYFVFRTIYAEPIYWLLGATLVAIGGLMLLYGFSWPGNLALVAGCVEVAFAIALLRRYHAAPAID